jgi:7,8-dihydropterin-6-yl-methyl-4-(beta-D-ribofuranosyl)aminobenzene 5'-phosphate synthase
MGSSSMKIRRIVEKLDELKVERIAPCHCSGDTAKDLFIHQYADNYIACGVGLALTIPGLIK